MTPESFLALTARNVHPAFLLSVEGTVLAANPSGSAVLGCLDGWRGGGLELADFVEDPPAMFQDNLKSWAAAGLPTNRPIRIRRASGGGTRYRGEGLRVMSTGPETCPRVLLHCVPIDPGAPSPDARRGGATGSRGATGPNGRGGPHEVDGSPGAAGPPRPASRRTTLGDPEPMRSEANSAMPDASDSPAGSPPGMSKTVGKMEAMGNLSAGIAHDFNNLLTVMKVEVELAMEQPDLPALIVDSLLSAHAAVVRAESLVRGLLAFSRHELLQTSEIDMQTLVDQALPKVLAITGSTPPIVRRAAVPLPVLIDPEHVETVLLALVKNAVEASEPGASISIRAHMERLGREFVRENEGSTEGTFAVLEVEDRGTGITPEVEARMFEPFFTTKGRGYGRGLGLAQAFGIVKTLGGYLKVESTVGSGSTFTVYLPIHMPPAPH